MDNKRIITMRRKNNTQTFFYILLLTITLVVVAFVIGIIVYLIVKGAGAINWEFLSQKPRNSMREGGIFPAILGTFYLVVGTLIIALPIGIFAAVYLNEYASKNRLTRINEEIRLKYMK